MLDILCWISGKTFKKGNIPLKAVRYKDWDEKVANVQGKTFMKDNEKPS